MNTLEAQIDCKIDTGDRMYPSKLVLTYRFACRGYS